MAAQVLEMNGGGFDLDDAVDAVDLDAAPPPPAEGVKVAIAESESDDEATAPQTAASHTYDKGYKRWEDFDVDAAADAVDVDDSFQKSDTYAGSKPGYVFKTGPRGTGYYRDAKPKVSAPTKPPQKKKPAPTTTKDGVDLTLPLFSSVPENQRPAAARALSLNDAALAQLPEDQQKTIRDFKRCYEKQKSDKAAGRVPGRVDAPEQSPEDIDWTLPILAKVPEDQKQSITMLLLMDESQMKTLPAESRETAQSFRKMYTEEKELKAQGPEAILKHAEQKKKQKTPEEAAKEARDRVMKPLVDLHNEMTKMKGWQLRESRAAWDALVATELAEKRAAEAADLRRRTKNVNEALDEVAVDTSKGALRLERAKDKSLKKKERARRKDRKDQLQKMRALASATSNLVM
mmetsp:Transcript_3800/g.9437  ORF Transcript_3800/g.9437 Transcript_3800/m.9437 type:complete len:404 (-) Transcript_3800:14-1225(-)